MYAVTAPRNIRALYYSREFGVRGANRILARESKQTGVVYTMSGTAARCRGLYRTKREALAARDRVLTMAANVAGRLGGDLAWGSLVEVAKAAPQDFAAVADVRPLAS